MSNSILIDHYLSTFSCNFFSGNNINISENELTNLFDKCGVVMSKTPPLKRKGLHPVMDGIGSKRRRRKEEFN